MGGYTSGRHGGKSCTDDIPSLDIRRIQQEGLLKSGLTFGWNWSRRSKTMSSIGVSVGIDSVTLSYLQSWRGGDWQSCSDTVLLTWTPCNYGGQRAWWLCPCCGRRVAMLYSGRNAHACRHCFFLAYRSQRETEGDLAARRADKLGKRLGWQGGILSIPSGKPKGMHWSTYERLSGLHARHAGVALADILKKIGGTAR